MAPVRQSRLESGLFAPSFYKISDQYKSIEEVNPEPKFDSPNPKPTVQDQ